MTTTINQRELRNDSGRIMRRVEKGESFTVTRNGTPVADLVPHDARLTAPGRRFVPVDSIESGLNAMPTWGAAAFGRELDDLDRGLDDRDLDRWGDR